jgi:5-methylcytosine-specific restriction endonuclease McrA
MLGMAQPPRPSDRSPEVRAYQHWYWTARWRRRRLDQLRAEPFCAFCLADGGVYTAATVADHVIPHRGDRQSFLNGKLQSLCKPHHDGDKQRMERAATPMRVDADGWPT